jgi:nucleoside-diphosphate-sugar epimerase
VFAASASGGWSMTGTNSPPHVDHRGLENVAVAAVANRVPRLVVVSSMLVTR